MRQFCVDGLAQWPVAEHQEPHPRVAFVPACQLDEIQRTFLLVKPGGEGHNFLSLRDAQFGTDGSAPFAVIILGVPFRWVEPGLDLVDAF